MKGAAVLQLNERGEYVAIPIIPQMVVWDPRTHLCTVYVDDSQVSAHCRVIERWTIPSAACAQGASCAN